MSILGDLGTAIKNKLALKANIASPTFTGVVTAPTFSGSLSGNATTAGGLAVATGTNNVANQIVRTDGNGYIQCGYIQSSGGNEHNASNPTYVWGTNGSDNYMRTYNTGYLSVNYANSSGSCSGNAATATTAANATKLNGQNWYWSGQGGQPSWLWGGSDGTNMYVYNPSNFSVNYANSAGSASSATRVNNVSFGDVGSVIQAICAVAANYGVGATVAGSNLRYSYTINKRVTEIPSGQIFGDFGKGWYGQGSTAYGGGGSALTGTWVRIGCEGVTYTSYNDYGIKTWYSVSLWQRIS